MKRIDGAEDEREMLEADVAVLFKQSPVCWISAMATVAVQQFAQAHPEMPVYTLDVLAQRELSRRLARELRIAHESPQIIVLRRGTPEWHASHLQITTERLREALV